MGMTVSGAWARVASGARAAGHGFAKTGRGAVAGAHAVGRTARRATSASGAGRSGLANLIELAAVHAAGDALVAAGLAGTLFFGVPIGEARGRVALYLLVTMAPFAAVAPLVGPALDRMRSGRRYAMAGTMALRAVLCWALAGAVVHQDAITLFPAAFGVLVLSKAFAVSRSSTTPRLLPTEITLVTANARVSLAALVSAAVAAPIGLAVATLAGPAWVLRVGTVVFIAGAVLGIRLPRNADSPDVEPAEDAQAQSARERGGPIGRSIRRMWQVIREMGPVVGEALLASVAIRILAGFLVFFLAFLLRVTQFGDVRQGVALGAIVVGAGIGAALGTSLGALVRSRAPQFIVLATLVVATAAVAVGAVFFGLVATVAVAFVVAVTQTLGKLAQDALVQREVPEEVRSSTFALTETFNQLAWVVGGAIGLAVSLIPSGTFGFAFIAGLSAVALVAVLVGRGRRLRDTRHTREEPLGTAAPPPPYAG